MKVRRPFLLCSERNRRACCVVRKRRCLRLCTRSPKGTRIRTFMLIASQTRWHQTDAASSRPTSCCIRTLLKGTWPVPSSPAASTIKFISVHYASTMNTTEIYIVLQFTHARSGGWTAAPIELQSCLDTTVFACKRPLMNLLLT